MTDTHLLICVVEEEELRTSFLEEEEEEEKERGTLVDLGGGRMEQWEALDRFNLNEKHKESTACLIFSKPWNIKQPATVEWQEWQHAGWEHIDCCENN